jgi:hypothetical protein
MDSIARKELSRVESGNKEIVTNEIIRFDFDEAVLSGLEYVFDDWEYAQNHGVRCNEDDEILMIDVDECMEEIDGRIIDNEDDNIREKVIKEYLEKYKGFTIWV